MPYPDPNCAHPLPDFPQVCFIKNTVTNPNILIGDYTYYDDPVDSENFERNVLYHYPFSDDKLIIGKFCALATGVQFIMNGANHRLSGFSTYPFEIFGCGWQDSLSNAPESPHKGDTVVDHDVWIGYQATILPGVHIGSGAVIAAKAVVTKDVPAYAIVGGNPAQIIRYRFTPEVIETLLTLAWWDWDIAKITRNLDHIVNADIAALAHGPRPE